MKIGIDIGGSHIAVGLVDNERILLKKEKDFLEEERINIKKSIEENLIKYIQEILNIKRISIKDIDKIRNRGSTEVLRIEQL